FGAAFDFEHLSSLECGQARMGEIKREGDSAGAVGCEPAVGEPEMGAENDAALVELAVEAIDAVFQLGFGDADAKIAKARGQQLFIAVIRPEKTSFALRC